MTLKSLVLPTACFAVGVALGVALPRVLTKPEPPTPQPTEQMQLDLDVGYAQSMLVHHQQALVMASLIQDAQANGGEVSPVKALAKRIMQAQALEIESLKGWLAGQGAAALPSDGDLMGWMKRQREHLNVNETLYLARCESSPLGMSGLVDPGTMKALGAPGMPEQEREARFLKLMVEHHEGAVAMSTLPARAAATGYIRNMAQHVLQTQSQEILLMRRWLLEGQTTLQ